MFTVFPDLSENLPTLEQELSQCDGLNARKIQQYGEAILDITRSFNWELVEATGDLVDPGEQFDEGKVRRAYFWKNLPNISK